MRLAGVWLVAALSLALAALAPTAARAQPFQGLYIGAGAGYNVPQNIQLDVPAPTSQRRYIVSNNGFATVGSIGYGLGNGFRFELEGNFRQDGFAQLKGPIANTGSGKIQTYGGMANVLFDMDIGFPWIYPYVGGGAGYEETRFNDIAATTASGRGIVLQGSSKAGSFAFQAIAGLSFPIPHVPGLSLTTEYRFMGIPGSETISSPTSTGSVKLDRQFTNSFLVGVRYAFGVTPPPPPPAAAAPPAPAPARTFQIFFDWDKATLTDRARQIVREAAEASTKAQTTRIEVNGYTDTSGTPQYNKGLSIRRAEAVAAELVKDGVARTIISIQGFGDTHLLVPTGPGVREPQNRRVEIVLK
jgi:outer membrane protein OmpA-like peptidoglycan-associated protein/opacity protein-like surface antigen